MLEVHNGENDIVFIWQKYVHYVVLKDSKHFVEGHAGVLDCNDAKTIQW